MFCRIRRWLKAGVVELGALDPTTMGMPQGGIISPLLANIALDGMERLFGAERADGRHVTPCLRRGSNRGINLVRYADDFVVTAPSREVFEGYVIPRLAEFLAGRGLELSEAKTRIVHIDDGFDFLGFNLRACSPWQAAGPAPEGEGRPAPQAALYLLPVQPADADGPEGGHPAKVAVADDPGDGATTTATRWPSARSPSWTTVMFGRSPTNGPDAAIRRRTGAGWSTTTTASTRAAAGTCGTAYSGSPRHNENRGVAFREGQGQNSSPFDPSLRDYWQQDRRTRRLVREARHFHRIHLLQRQAGRCAACKVAFEADLEQGGNTNIGRRRDPATGDITRALVYLSGAVPGRPPRSTSYALADA